MAKLPKVKAENVIDVARRILNRHGKVHDLPGGEFWQWAYYPDTLLDLCRLRESFLRKCDTDEKKVLRAVLMGALHGTLTKGPPSYCSNQCTRTFAPKPAYAVRFWKSRGMQPPKVDVLAVLERRANRLLAEQPRRGRGWITRGDIRQPSVLSNAPKFSYVVTSPPYYGMRTYIPDQWLRYWFVGGPPQVVYGHPQAELHHHSADEFTDQLAQVWSNLKAVCKPDARMVIRFGGIQDRKRDPMELLRVSLCEGGWRAVTARRAGDAHDGKRQASQFGVLSRPLLEWDVYAQIA
jgi:hypothetical protein